MRTPKKKSSRAQKALGARIRKLRQESGLTVAAFCALAQVSSNYLHVVERGELPPSGRLVRRIARICGTTEQWLRTGNGGEP